MTTKWLRVCKLSPCPICHKPDWCLISPDGQTSICARVASDKKAGEAGWLHQIGSTPLHSSNIKSRPEVIQTPLSAPQARDRVYRALLSTLTLSDRHRNNLLSRGLNNHQIETLGYVSFPIEDRQLIINRLTKTDLKLSGVPGFYLDCGQVKLAGPAGMLIPVKDVQSRIVGLQVRCDDTTDGKYKWFSSAKKPYGCGSGCPIHVVGKPTTASSELWVTEGPLKADIASMYLNKLFLAISGVGNWHSVPAIVSQIRPQRVILCFDMDKYQNSTVRLHLEALSNSLIRLRIRTFEADWDSHFKGLDDLLTEAR